MSNGDQGWYVYCVGEAAALERAAGDAALQVDLQVIAQEQPRNQRVLAALTRTVSLEEFGEASLRERLNDLEWLQETALDHERAVDAALAKTTIVPLRLCTIYRSAEAVRDMLARERTQLLRALKALEGTSEWGVKLYASSQYTGEGDQSDEELDLVARIQQSTPGQAYMLQRRLARVRAQRGGEVLEQHCSAVHEALASHAVGARLNPLQNPELDPHDGRMISNGVYLVHADRRPEFVAAVDALRERVRPIGLDVVLTGPWPPYNFVGAAEEQ